jgi:hypothetical protein
MSKVSRVLPFVAAAVAATVSLSGHQAAGGRPAVTRSIYAAVTGEDGRPVLDMRPTDFEVRNNGTPRPFELQPVTELLRVALILSLRERDDRLIPAARAFCESFEGNGEVSVISVLGDAETLSDYSERAGDCLAALGRLELHQNRASHLNPNLVDAVLATASGMRREGRRSAIVVLRAGGEQPSPLYGERILAPIRASGAVLYVASTSDAAQQLSTQWGLAMATLVDSAVESGGRHLVVGADPSVARSIAWELATSYRIQFTLADDAAGRSRLSVTSNRPGVKVLAPTRTTR